MRTNFTMTPNIAFDLLTNEFDLVGYQKLLRVVGMGNSWKGGNNALAAKLNMSYGRVIKLRKTLEEVGFIAVQKGDNKHGEADTWQVLDIWQVNAEATLSPNEQGSLSPNEQGTEAETGENLLNDEIIDVEPCHETNNPLSPNEQATLSRNEQHKEKIFIKEDIQDTEEESYDSSFVRLSANDEELREAICSKIGVKPKVKPITPEEWQSLVRIFGFWKKTFGKNSRTRLTTERGRAVLDRLRSFQNFTDDEIEQAILGCKASPNHNGTNGTVYNDLELICRTDDKLAQMIGYYEAAQTLAAIGENNGSNQKPNGQYQSTSDKRLQNEIESEQLIRSLLGKAEQESVSSESYRTLEAHSPPC